MKYISIILIIILSSCSSQWHLRKAIVKDPSILIADTVTVLDTLKIITENIQVDSIFKQTTDTVVINKEKLTIKYYHYRDSVYIFGECESDTIVKYRKIKVPFNQVIQETPFISNRIGIIIILLIVGLIIYRVLLK